MTDSPLDKLLEVGTQGSALEVVRRRAKHPTGWTPGLDTERGVLVTAPLAEAPSDWDAILRELLPEGFDTTAYQIDGDTVEVRAWDGNVGGGELKRLYYFKARIRKRVADLDRLDIDDLVAAAKKAKPRPVAEGTNDRTYFIQITDLQAGQADGDGAEGMVARALQIPQLVRDVILHCHLTAMHVVRLQCEKLR